MCLSARCASASLIRAAVVFGPATPSALKPCWAWKSISAARITELVLPVDQLEPRTLCAADQRHENLPVSVVATAAPVCAVVAWKLSGR